MSGSSESLAQAVANNTNWINSVIATSKLSSQLVQELTSINSLDQKIVVQEGILDAKHASVKTIRGYKGNWEADTNNPILSNSSGVVGDIYKVSIGGNIDIGSGSIDYVAGDLVYLSENNWIKISPNQISDITGLQLALDALSGGLIPQGTWDALLNNPDIDGGTAETGYFWIVSTAGTTNIGGINDWEINDWAVKTATGWAKIDNTDKVLSVAGRTGVIVLSITDITGLTVALANCVKLTGDQSIAGKKTFTEDLTATANQDIRGNLTIGTLRQTENEAYAINALDDNSVIAFGDNSLTTQNVMVGEFGVTDTDQLWLHGKNGTFFSHDGDVNEAITIAMVIADDGKIGMGTDNPSAKLHIQGTASSNGGIRLHNSGGNPYSIWSDNNDLFISKGDGVSTAISVKYGGNVGIGTDSPNAQLDIFNGTTGASFKLSATATAYWQLQRDSITGNLNISDDALGNVMSFDQLTGNVGIGTDSPLSKLHAKGGSISTPSSASDFLANATARLVVNHANEYGAYVGYLNSTNDAIGIQSAKSNGVTTPLSLNPYGGNVGIGTDTPTDKLDIKASNSQLRLTDADDSTFTQFSSSGGKLAIRQDSTSDSHFWLTSAGYVGIGTDSPNNPLHIKSSSAVLLNLECTGASSFAQLSNSGGAAGIKSTANDLILWTSTSGTERMRITSSGILTIAGGATLNSNKDAYIANSDSVTIIGSTQSLATAKDMMFDTGQESMRITAAGNVTILGSTTAANFILSSDVRLKKDFLPLYSKRLSPKRWTWKDSDKKDFGFIAQELEVDFPEVVVTGQDGFKKVAYNKITAINSARINELEDEISELKIKLELIMNSLK